MAKRSRDPKICVKKCSTKESQISASSPKVIKAVKVNDWNSLVQSLKKKDDYKVRYYFSGNLHNQGDRDWVAQAAVYFNGRTKRQDCPIAAIVTAQLPNFVQGYTQDLNPHIAPIVTFKTSKHIFGFMDYVSSVRNEHNDIVVHISVDDSPFYAIF